MTSTIQMPPFATPAKPSKGAACNGCGWCCHMEVCAIGKRAFPGGSAPCPAITYQDGVVRCGLVLAEQELMRQRPEAEPMLHEMLGIGQGCCADDPREAA